MPDIPIFVDAAAPNAPPPGHILRRLGPGLITGAADDDPSGIATYSQVGAQFGYGLAWTMLFSLPFMVVVQEISGRIGCVSGRGIADTLRRHYPAWLVHPIVLLLLPAHVVNLGADVGAMGAALRLLLGGSASLYTLLFGILCIVAEVFISYRLYSGLLKWLTLSLFAYVGVVFSVHLPWDRAIGATLVPCLSLDHEGAMALVAVLRTTISPYLFLWQAALKVEERRRADPGSPCLTRAEAIPQLRRIRLDTIVGMGVSNVVAIFIIYATAATLLAPPVMAVMMLVASDPRVMGPLTLSASMRIGGWSATAPMLAAAIAVSPERSTLGLARPPGHCAARANQRGHTMKLLHVDSSILGENSVSRSLSAAVVARCRDLHPDLEVIRRDLVATPVAHLTGAYLAGQSADVQHNQALQEELTLGGAVLAEFLDADIIVVGSPLYNLTIPSQLKSWLDRIIVAGKTFRYTANGPEGLIHSKRAVLVMTRGGFYGPDSPRHSFEHGESYLKSMFAFIGLTDQEVIVAEGLAVNAEQRQRALESARSRIEAMADLGPAA